MCVLNAASGLDRYPPGDDLAAGSPLQDSDQIAVSIGALVGPIMDRLAIEQPRDIRQQRTEVCRDDVAGHGSAVDEKFSVSAGALNNPLGIGVDCGGNIERVLARIGEVAFVLLSNLKRSRDIATGRTRGLAKGSVRHDSFSFVGDLIARGMLPARADAEGFRSLRTSKPGRLADAPKNDGPNPPETKTNRNQSNDCKDGGEELHRSGRFRARAEFFGNVDRFTGLGVNGALCRFLDRDRLGVQQQHVLIAARPQESGGPGFLLPAQSLGIGEVGVIPMIEVEAAKLQLPPAGFLKRRFDAFNDPPRVHQSVFSGARVGVRANRGIRPHPLCNARGSAALVKFVSFVNSVEGLTEVREQPSRSAFFVCGSECVWRTEFSMRSSSLSRLRPSATTVDFFMSAMKSDTASTPSSSCCPRSLTELWFPPTRRGLIGRRKVRRAKATSPDCAASVSITPPPDERGQ